MSSRGLPAFAFLSLLGTAGALLAFRPHAAPAAPRAQPAQGVKDAPPTAAAVLPPASRFSALPPLHIENQTTHALLDVKLYDKFGQVDEVAASRIDELLCDARDPKHHHTGRINRRTLQLLFKAAYHFGRYEVEVVSAYRKPGRHREGPHGTGAAVDFRLRDLAAPLLASYLRDSPRTGIGVYTHPKTQYVHLDSRELSFHWLDASPPRRHWRERSIGAADLMQRDKSYTPSQDLPEGLASEPATAAAAR